MRVRIHDVYLPLFTMDDGSQTSVGVPYEEAVRLDRKGFARLYRKHVTGASRREANRWADRQIEARSNGLFASSVRGGAA